MNWRTCYGCTVDGPTCPVRAVMRAPLKGLGITSISFKCVERKPAFQQGQRITVTWPFHEDEDPDGMLIDFHATVITEHKPGRYYIRIDNGPDQTIGEYEAPKCLNSNGHAHVSFTRLAALDEPPRAVCAVCGEVDGITKDCYGHGPGYGEGRYVPFGCARPAKVA